MEPEHATDGGPSTLPPPRDGEPGRSAPLERPVLERAEELAERMLADRAPRKRMLVIVNPSATTVSDRLRNLVVYALQARYAVEAIDTRARGHATELCREAAREGYDVVVAFGGDGTVNEAANGLVGTDTPLTCLPGGATNVFCRSLGIPADVVDATEHLLGVADHFRPRRVDLGIANGRRFVFAAGMGLDGSVIAQVERHPTLKGRYREWFFASAVAAAITREYLLDPPRLRVEVGGRSFEGITAVVQNSDPFTYFRRRPVRVSEGAGLDAGTLGLAVLRRVGPLGVVAVASRMLSGSARAVARSRAIEALPGVTDVTVHALGRPLPVEVDGDNLGLLENVRFQAAPGALWVVA